MLPALTRSTGIVATVLLVAAMSWGFVFSARATGLRLRPAWWLDLHNWLGGLALCFIGAHLALAWADSGSGIGAIEVLIPNTASVDAWAVTWGVLATYLSAAAVFTTWPRRWRRRRWWRAIHLGAVAGTVLAVVHGLQLGSDAGSRAVQAGVIVLAAGATYSIGLRVFSLVESPDSQGAPSPRSSSTEDDLAN